MALARRKKDTTDFAHARSMRSTCSTPGSTWNRGPTSSSSQARHHKLVITQTHNHIITQTPPSSSGHAARSE
eukprot:555724-Rhodomonas_salina.1